MSFTNLISDYWIVGAGAVVIYFYAKYHFNTPDYALLRSDATGEERDRLPKDSPSARLHCSAPPIFTTPRDRYRRSEMLYVIGLEFAFLMATVFPDLLKGAKAPGLTEFLSQSLQDRAIIGCLVLTGFLSSFPIIKDFDAWLLNSLHKRASIPDDAEETADELFTARYEMGPETLSTILRDVQSLQLRQIADENITGILESRWLNLRCLIEEIKSVLQDDRYRLFRRKFDSEAQDIYRSATRLRASVGEQLRRQSDTIGDKKIKNVDEWIEASIKTDTEIASLNDARRSTIFEVDALFYRICLFTSLLVYSTGRNIQDINRSLRRLGFLIRIYTPPRVPWSLILAGALAVLVICLMTTLPYMLIVQRLSVPPALKTLVPNTPLEGAGWSIIACLLHSTAAVVAAKLVIREIKERRDSGLELRVEEPLTQSTVVGAWSTLIPALILTCFAFTKIGDFNDLGSWAINGAKLLLWLPLPFVTAFFTATYFRNNITSVPNRRRLPLIQALCMSLSTFLLALITCPANDLMSLWPTAFWVYAAYASLTTALIGVTLGEVFRRGLRVQAKDFAATKQSSQLSFLPEPSFAVETERAGALP